MSAQGSRAQIKRCLQKNLMKITKEIFFEIYVAQMQAE
jgi:hypothetical protein